MLLYIVIAVAILALTLGVWVAYYMDLGSATASKVVNVLLSLRIALTTIVSIWLIAVVLQAVFS